MIDTNKDIVPVFVVDGERSVKKGFFNSRPSCEYLRQTKGRNSPFQENLMTFSPYGSSIVLVTEDVAQEVLAQVTQVDACAGMFIVVPSYKGAVMAMAMAAYALKAQGRLMLLIDVQDDISRAVSMDAILSPEALKRAEEKCVSFDAGTRGQGETSIVVCRPRVFVELLQQYDPQVERQAQKSYFAYKDTDRGRIVARELYSNLPAITLCDFQKHLQENSFVCLAVQNEKNAEHAIIL